MPINCAPIPTTFDKTAPWIGMAGIIITIGLLTYRAYLRHKERMKELEKEEQ